MGEKGWGPPSDDPKSLLFQGLLVEFGWIERGSLNPGSPCLTSWEAAVLSPWGGGEQTDSPF